MKNGPANWRFPTIDSRDRIDLADAYYDHMGHEIGLSVFIGCLYTVIFLIIVVRMLMDALGILSWEP